MAAVAAACGLGDASLPVYVVDTAGVVANSSPTGGDHLVTYILEDGQTVNVDARNWISGSSGNAGDLLLVGGSPEPWAYAAQNQPAGSAACFVVPGAATDHGDDVDIRITASARDVYLRVPKATSPIGSLAYGVCLDEAGRAHSISQPPTDL